MHSQAHKHTHIHANTHISTTNIIDMAQHGTKLRWRDRARKDLKKFGIDESGWLTKALDRGSWRSACNKGLKACTKKRVESDLARRSARSANHNTECQVAAADQYQYKCDTCQRSFRRRQDISRHKCVTTRPKRRGPSAL